MKKNRWIIFGLALLLVLPASMPAFGWDQIVSFGDSLSDDGNGGYNNFPGFVPPGATGPSSDGPVWLNYLAESMKHVELEGRAIGGAQTEGPIASWIGADIGMTAQVSRYLETLGEDADLSGILFTMWIGGNDFLDKFNPADPFAVIDPAIERIDNALQDLVDAGAKDLLVMTLPDLGLAPYVIDIDQAYQMNGALIAAFTYASGQFNEALKAVVCNLRDVNADKKVEFYMADTFKLLQYAVDTGEALGFENVDYPCTWPGGPSCDVAIFFDGIHPTTFTHQYLAALALGQVKHGHVSKDLKAALKLLDPIHPQMPFIVNCYYGDYTNDKKVLKEIEKSVKGIVKKDGADPFGDVDFLVARATDIAIKAIWLAEASDGDAKKIDKAWRHFDKAEEQLEKEKFDKAVKEYRKAWENAQKALDGKGKGKGK